jgi:hypothetical protein
MSPLEAVTIEIEAHAGRAGWDRPPALFALVPTERILTEDPAAAANLGLTGSGYTPVEQEDLPAGELDEVLAQIAWPDSVEGCAVSHEIVLLPPDAEDEVGDDVQAAAAHPHRREARLVVAVLQDGTSSAVLRLRDAASSGPEDLLTGPDLAPNLVTALLATFG